MSLLIMLKWFALLLTFAAALFLLIRLIGQQINRRTPAGGINESFYTELNGAEQWISIYGKDRNNPVVLYLHGGPGASTSRYDYAFTRKWADVYTVVTWDQRGCGKSCRGSRSSGEISADLLVRDGLALTKFLLRYLKKDRITVLGHSWGSYLGSRLVASHPELFEGYIAAGLLVDACENEAAFREEAAKWAGNDASSRKLVQQLAADTFSPEYLAARNALMKQYGYDMFADGTDYSMAAAHIFNPYYSLLDFYRCMKPKCNVYEGFLRSDAFRKLSLLGHTEYQVPFYLVSGDKDYQTNFRLAQAYFDTVNAPRKKCYTMRGATHGLLESRSEEFSEIIHQIAGEEYAHRSYS